MKRFKKAIKIIAIIVVIVFLGFPVTLFYVDLNSATLLQI